MSPSGHSDRWERLGPGHPEDLEDMRERYAVDNGKEWELSQTKWRGWIHSNTITPKGLV